MESLINNLKLFDQELKKQRSFGNKSQPFFQPASDAICLFDSNHKFMFINFAGARLFGMEPAAFEGKHWREVGLPADAMQGVEEVIDRVFVAGKLQRGILSWLVNAGLQSFEYSMSPLYRSKDKIGAVLFAAHEIIGLADDDAEVSAIADDIAESKLYGSLMVNMPVGIAYFQTIYDDSQPEDFVFRAANQAFTALTGLKNVVGRKITAVFPGIKESIPEIFKVFGKAGVQRCSERFETYFRPLDAWLSITVSSNGNGRVLAIVDNITTRKLAEKNLQECEDRWRSALENAGHGVWQLNFKSGRVYFSAGYKKILDYSPAEMIDTVEAWKSRVHPDDLERVLAVFRRHTGGLEPHFSTEYRIRGKDGRYRWVLARGGFVSRDEMGEPVEYIGTLSDISERKKIEEALKESEQRFRLLFENVNDAIFLLELDADNNPVRFREVNDVACRQLGYSRDELLALSLNDIAPLADLEERGISFSLLKSQETVTFETVHRKKDGNTLFVEISAHYITMNGVVYVLAVARDLTERRRAEAAIEKVNQRRRRNDILNELLKGNQLAKQRVREMVFRAGISPWKHFSCYQLVITEWNSKPREYWQEDFEKMRNLQDTIVESLEKGEAWVAWVNSSGIGVLHFGNPGEQDVKKYQLETARQLQLHVTNSIPGMTLAIGIAEVAAEITDLADRFQQSCTAVNLGYKIWPERNIFHYMDMGHVQLIPSYIGDQKLVADYIERNLGKLLHYERKNKDEFLSTLEAILETGNLKEAAKRVFVHEKTLLQRRSRIELILGVSLDSFETRMALATALKLMKLTAKNSI